MNKTSLCIVGLASSILLLGACGGEHPAEQQQQRAFETKRFDRNTLVDTSRQHTMLRPGRPPSKPATRALITRGVRLRSARPLDHPHSNVLPGVPPYGPGASGEDPNDDPVPVRSAGHSDRAGQAGQINGHHENGSDDDPVPINGNNGSGRTSSDDDPVPINGNVPASDVEDDPVPINGNEGAGQLKNMEQTGQPLGLDEQDEIDPRVFRS
jgi:hypothetical protein